jgi:aminoglycoside phosphotransferase (APT) family kinase protein
MTITVPETIEVRAAHRFDEARLMQFLKEQLEDFAGPLIVRQFAGGQSNPTFYLSAGGRQYVLRKKPPGHLLPSAHQVEREYRIITALAQTGVPVCRTRLLCEDTSVIGTAFYLMDYVPGRVFRNLLLPELEPAERTAIYDAMNEVLAKLHCLDYLALGLSDFGKPGNYYARQISRWSRQYEAAKTEEIEAMNRLIAWLPENIPPDDETTIVHGDYRLENMIFHPTEPRVLAVLDWELSTLGHPLGDLAYNCLPYHFAMYGGQGLLELDSAATGIPDEASYVGAYCRRTGRAGIEHWNFYLAFALFRSASIAQGVYARGLQGNASSETATQYGAVVRKMAERAWDLVEQASLT